MRTTEMRRAFGILALILAGAEAASAGPIIGNIGSNNHVGSYNYVGAGSTAAMGFTMGPTSYTLSSVEVLLTISPGIAVPTLALYSNNNGTPGSDLLTLSTTAGTAGGNVSPYTYTPGAGGPLTLAANTSYWLVMSSSGQSEWDSYTTLPLGAAATAIPGSLTGTNGGTPTSPSSVISYYEVDGAPLVAVPEPSGLVMAGTALVTLMAAARAYRRRGTAAR